MRTAAVLAMVWVIAIAAGLLMWTNRQFPAERSTKPAGPAVEKAWTKSHFVLGSALMRRAV